MRLINQQYSITNNDSQQYLVLSFMPRLEIEKKTTWAYSSEINAETHLSSWQDVGVSINSCQCLTDNDSKREHVYLLVVSVSAQALRRHPKGRSNDEELPRCVRRHRILSNRQAKIADESGEMKR